MDVERMLVCKVAHERAIGRLTAVGVDAKHFEDSHLREIWAWMQWHYRTYSQAPSIGSLTLKFPSFLWEVVEENVDYLRDQFFRQVKRRYAVEALRSLADEIDSEDSDVEESFLRHARTLARLVPSNTSFHFKDMEQRIETYFNEGVLVGIPMGIPTFDSLTNGIQPTEYVTIMGWQGRGKSTLAQWILHNAYWELKTPMYISLEMGAGALLRKWDTMATNRAGLMMEYDNLKKGYLTPKEVQAWRNAASEVRQRKNDIIIKDVDVDCTVDYVYAEMQRHNPDIVCIDYITLMKTPREAGQSSWERVQYLTNNLKQIARATGIPIIGVAQTNRSSAKGMPEAEQVGFGLSIVQDSDIVMSLHQDEEAKADKRMNVSLLKNRDGATNEEALYWNMDHMRFAPWEDHKAFVVRDSTKRENEEEAWETPVPADAAS